MDRSITSKRQTDALKIEALRAYFDFREGRPTAESVAEKLGIPVRTVRDWLADNRNGKLLDELVPLWPNIGSARQFASEHAQEALETLVSLMRSTKNERVRLEATTTLLALAGVRPAHITSDEKPQTSEQQRPAVLLNLFLDGGQTEHIQVIEGQVTNTDKPVRIAGEVIRQIAEPTSES